MKEGRKERWPCLHWERVLAELSFSLQFSLFEAVQTRQICEHQFLEINRRRPWFGFCLIPWKTWENGMEKYWEMRMIRFCVGFSKTESWRFMGKEFWFYPFGNTVWVSRLASTSSDLLLWLRLRNSGRPTSWSLIHHVSRSSKTIRLKRTTLRGKKTELLKIGIHRRGIDRSITEQTEFGGRKQDPSTTSFWERSKSAFPRERGIGGRPWSATPFPAEPDIPLDKRSCCWSITAALAAGEVAVRWFWWGSSEISLEGLLMGLRSQGDLGFEGLRSGQEQEGIVLSICSRKSSLEAAEGSKWWKWEGGIWGGGGFKWWSAWRSWRDIWEWFKRELRDCISLLQGCIVSGGEKVDGDGGGVWNI